MKKHIFTLSAIIMIAHMAWAAAVTTPSDIPSYYSAVDGKSGSNLWSAVSSTTNKGYHSIGYNGLYNAYLKTDVYPSDSVGKAGKIWDMYGECGFSNGEKCGSYSGVCDCYNREHSIPQSWWGGGTGGIGNDIFHVLPTDGKINGVRSNYEYGEVNGGTNWNGNKYGSAGSWATDKKTIATDANESVKGSGNVFEPKPQYKGDWARGILGTIVKWQQSNLTTSNNFFSGTYDAAHYFGLTKKAVVLLMKWHREDPVSQKEIDRNNGIQQTQGNRNPFIDYPYLAEYIWGEHAGETVDMAKLMPSTDKDFVPGKSDGWRSGSTPVTPAVRYGVTWSVNGEELRTDSVEENKQVSALPATPVSCSTESNVFVGWTIAAIEGTTDDEPAALYTAVKDFPAVTADVTYYAVFAKATEEAGAAAATYTYSADSKEGWTNTASKTNTYWLLDSGKELTSPEVDLSGLGSIQVRMRTYGGTQYDQLQVAAGATVITTIEASKGSTMTDYEWTNTKSLSGTSPLTFTCSNAASNKGIGFESVTINVTGAGTAYSRYITSCQGTTELVNRVVTGQPARKVLIGGQIYILIGEQLYTPMGQRIR
ncbi:MAG: endonuclease [Paludibacteraceae bacterium]|nr:endonuclease [Paludibacteraceae bacterium]MBR0065380.1 endonuclease [Paludibacteraceae bacterium]